MAEKALRCLRRAVRADHAALAALWRRSVGATPAFLSPAAVTALHAAARRDSLAGGGHFNFERPWLLREQTPVVEA